MSNVLVDTDILIDAARKIQTAIDFLDEQANGSTLRLAQLPSWNCLLDVATKQSNARPSAFFNGSYY